MRNYTDNVWRSAVTAIADFHATGQWSGALLLLTAAALGIVTPLTIGWLLRRLFGATSNRRRPPGPWGLPIVGYLPFLSREAPFVSLSKLARRYGPIFRLRLGSIPTVVIADAALLHLAFKKDAFCGRPPLFITNGILEGCGLIAAEGDRWKEQRRFAAKRLRAFGATKSTLLPSAVQLEKRIVHEISAFHRKMYETDGRPTDFRSMLLRTVANLSTTLLFGKTFAEGDPDFDRELEVADHAAEIVDICGTLNFLPLLRHLPKFRRFFRDLWAMKERHHKFLAAIVDEHRKSGSTNDGDGREDDRDFIHAYLAEMDRRKSDGKGRPSYFDDKQLRHVLSDLFGASLDTTRATVEWTFLHLVHNRRVQTKCQQEMDAIVGRHRVPTLDDRRACNYTAATVLEAQRLANVAPLGAPHGAIEDAFLGDYFIPNGTMILPLLWEIHSDPNVWPEPQAFRPERFLDEDGKVRVPEHFVPFSSGKRMCVGEEFAKMMLFLIVAVTLHRFTLRLPADEVGVEADLTPVSGFIIKPRAYRMSAVARHPRRLLLPID